jgi:hypothetical protein
VSNEALRAAVEELLQGADLLQVSYKQLNKQLEDKLQVGRRTNCGLLMDSKDSCVCACQCFN